MLEVFLLFSLMFKSDFSFFMCYFVWKRSPTGFSFSAHGTSHLHYLGSVSFSFLLFFFLILARAYFGAVFSLGPFLLGGVSRLPPP